MKKVISAFMCLILLLLSAFFVSAEESPQLYVTSEYRIRDFAEVAQYEEFKFTLSDCPDFESFELLITYDPNVLEYVELYPSGLADILRNTITCSVLTPGKLQVIGRRQPSFLCSEFDLLGFKYISDGAENISVELVSFEITSGKSEDVMFVYENITSVSPQLNLTASKQWSDLHSESAGLYACFEYSLRNCPDFESCELIITYNPEVLQYVKGYPFSLDLIERKQTSCTVLEPGTLQVIGNDNDCGNNEFDPFCFKVIGKGDTDISVELVSFKTADDEVENVNFDATVYNFTVTQVYVKYDLNGDETVSAEDARLALRFAVGLDTATDDQRYAAGLVGDGEFTSVLARDILRAAVGLHA